LHRELARRLELPVAPAIVNAVPARLFTRADEMAIARLEASGERHPHVAAARFLLERRRGGATPGRAPRAALGAAAVRLPFLFAGPEADGGIEVLARELAQAARLAA